MVIKFFTVFVINLMICNVTASDLSDYHIKTVDLQGQNLNLQELRTLLHEVENNSNIGNIKWGNIVEEGSELKEQIENQIIQNNKLYSRHPTDFIHALLSAHVYKNRVENTIAVFDNQDENNVYNKYLKDWQVYRVYYYPEEGQYYAIVYINKKSGQLVLAHRGTKIKPKDLGNIDSALRTNLKGILGQEIVAQQAAAYKVIKEVIQDAKRLQYNLSITGHSLGAWLAELSLYFCYRDFNYSEAKAVTFDSPGSVIHIDKLQPNIINYITEFDIKNLNIVTYLSAPNLVNSCNKHVGRVYRLFPEIHVPPAVKKITNLSSWFKEKFNWLKRDTKDDSKSLEGLWPIFGHSLNPLIAVFEPRTGKPRKYEEILDWPVIKYIPSNAEEENSVAKLVNTVAELLLPNDVIKFKNSIENSTLTVLLTVLNEAINGRIERTQYLNYFEYIDSNSNSGTDYIVRENLSANEEFSLTYEGHYRTKPVNVV